MRSTRKGKPVTWTPRPGQYRFQYAGRDDRGVASWRGQWQALKWGFRILTLSGFCLAAGALFMAAVGIARGPGALAAVGAIHLALSYWMRTIYRRIEGYSTAEQLARDLNLTPESVIAAADSLQLKPRIAINGEYYYDPADLGDSGRLLRAAQAPPEGELLRAAGFHPGGADSLLIPAEGASDAHLSAAPAAPAEVAVQGLQRGMTQE